MTFQEAAMEVLRRVGKPLSAQKIAQLAVKHNLLTVVGKTPEDTMASRLDVATRDQYASDSPFVRAAKAGVYSLREWGGNPPGPPAGGGFEDVAQSARAESGGSARAERGERGDRGSRGEGAAGGGGAEAGEAGGEARGEDRDGRGKRRRRGGRGGKGRAEAGAAGATEGTSGRAPKEAQPPRERPGREARPAKDRPSAAKAESDADKEDESASAGTTESSDAAGANGGDSSEDRRRGRRGRRGGRRRRGRGGAETPAAAQSAPPAGGSGAGGAHAPRPGGGAVRAFAGSGGGNGHSLGARHLSPSLPPMAGGGGTPARALESAAFGVAEEDAMPELSGEPMPAYGGPQTVPAFPVGTGVPGAPAADVPAGAARIPSLVDAAYVVMRSSGARAPLHFHRIAELGRAAGLRASGPAIHAAILADNERRAARGLTPLFAPGQKGEWALTEWALPDRVARLEQRLWELTREMRAATQAEIAAQLRTFDAASFQQLMALLLERQGYGDIRLASRSSEGNVALAGTLHHGLARVGTALVLRTGGGPAMREHVRDLRARLAQLSASQGVILALSGVSSDARLEADAPGPPVRILDADEIAELLVSVQLGVSIGHVRVVRPDLDFFNELRRR